MLFFKPAIKANPDAVNEFWKKSLLEKVQSYEQRRNDAWLTLPKARKNLRINSLVQLVISSEQPADIVLSLFELMMQDIQQELGSDGWGSATIAGGNIRKLIGEILVELHNNCGSDCTEVVQSAYEQFKTDFAAVYPDSDCKARSTGGRHAHMVYTHAYIARSAHRIALADLHNTIYSRDVEAVGPETSNRLVN